MAYIDGMKKLNQRLYKLAEGKAVADAMGKCLALVEGESKENCPVQTGELRRSITSRMKQEPTLIQGTSVLDVTKYSLYTFNPVCCRALIISGVTLIIVNLPSY